MFGDVKMILKDEHSALAIVLIKEKSQTKVMMIKNKNGWVFPKGHIEENETEEDAAIRECYEESGINLKSSKRLGKVDEFHIVFGADQLKMLRKEFFAKFNADYIRKTISVYCFELPYSQTFILEEGFTAGMWIHVNDAFRVLAYEENKIALSKALQLINKEENDLEVLI